MPSGRTAMYSPEDIFPLGITHPSRPAAKLWLVRAISLSQTKKWPLGVLLCTAQGPFLNSGAPIHPGLVFAGGCWKVEFCMSETGNNGSMWHLFLCAKGKNAKAD